MLLVAVAVIEANPIWLFDPRLFADGYIALYIHEWLYSTISSNRRYRARPVLYSTEPLPDVVAVR